MHFDKRIEITNNKSDAIKIQQQQQKSSTHTHREYKDTPRSVNKKRWTKIYKNKMYEKFRARQQIATRANAT